MSNLSDFIGGRMVRKFQLLTSSGTWSLPANLLGDVVEVSAIAGGEAHNSTGPVYGQGGSYMQKYPYTVSSSVSYTIGAAGSGTAGANGTDTVWGTITLQGGGEADCTGALGRNSTAGLFPQSPPGPFGSFAPASSSSKGGGGLMLNGTLYGQGGTGGAGGAGAILLEWWEKA